MNNRSHFNAEDFLVDNTFQLYCSGADRACIEYWERYIASNPDQAAVIQEAKSLYVILSGNKRPLNTQLAKMQEQIRPVHKTFRLNGVKSWLKIAAVLFLIAAGSVFVYKQYISDLTDPKTAFKAQVFKTTRGEKKKIILPDGSTVLLNAQSELLVMDGFNGERREVNLRGEAFFDVSHNKDKPFKVHTDAFNINVLGTAFNVKVYPGESQAEATLIRGLITMESLNGAGGIITLKPSQKVTFYKDVQTTKKQNVLKPAAVHPDISIKHYTLIKDSSIVETAWTKNRLEIYDQDFAELKYTLERWFNVEISFTDPEIEKYRFTATFNNETIEEVLDALKKVENFKYEIKENQILISKQK